MLLTLGMRTYVGLSPVATENMQVASMPLGLVWTQVPLISCSTRSSKLPFFKKATTVVLIVNLVCIKDCKEWREGCMHETWIFEQMPPPHFCLKVVCKKEGIFLGAYGTYLNLSQIGPPSKKAQPIFWIKLLQKYFSHSKICPSI